jgi:chromate transporter
VARWLDEGHDVHSVLFARGDKGHDDTAMTAARVSIGIFMPVYVFTIIPAPWFSRNRDNALLKAFALGATAAATGAITGAVILLARRAIYGVPTAAVALVSLAVL